jgi:hypothetical protein
MNLAIPISSERTDGHTLRRHPAGRLFLALLTMMILGCGSSSGQATFLIHQFTLAYKGDLKPRLTIKADYWFNDRISFNSYLYAGPGWGEGVAGAGYQLKKWIYVGFMIGLQNDKKHPLRIMPNFYLSQGKFSLLGLFGHGFKTETDRFALQFFYNMKSFKIGAEAIKEFTIYALGPRFDFTCLNRPPLHIWAAPYWDFTYGKFAAMFGIYAIFGKKGVTETD